jgi:hypothetical protein
MPHKVCYNQTFVTDWFGVIQLFSLAQLFEALQSTHFSRMSVSFPRNFKMSAAFRGSVLKTAVSRTNELSRGAIFISDGVVVFITPEERTADG